MNPQTTDQGTVTDAVEQFIPQPFTENGFSGNTSPDEISKHWKNGEFTGGVFAGNPTGNPYTYQRNYDTNKLEFSSNVQGTVMVEYIGSPQVQGNDFCIHPFLEEPLMYWLEWKDRAFKDRVGVGDKMRLRKQYHDAKRWAKMQFNSRSPQEIRNKQRKGYSLTPS
jgi:hypothetical protein